jgi:microcystin-dependent protein
MLKKMYLFCIQICMLSSLAATATIVYADEPFIGEVRWFAGNFTPRGWASCDGQLLSIASNTALFSILGTTYGGDGRSTFGLPDLRGRGMVHFGNGPGLTPHPLGQKAGTETETLQVNQLPVHTHTQRAERTRGDSVLPDDRVVSRVGRLRIYDNTSDVDMGNSAITASGGGQPHNNTQPSIALNCIIALQGIFPSRN